MLKKILAFFLLTPMFFVCSNDTSNVFDLPISLGNRCQTALRLTVNNVRNEAYPFDWIISPFESIIKFLDLRGEGFLNPDYLIVNYNSNPEKCIVGIYDVFYGITFVHDFDYYPKGHEFPAIHFSQTQVTNFNEIKSKFERRIERFFKICESDKRILFVRVGLNREESIVLVDTFRKNFPKLDFMILAVGDSDSHKTPWNVDRVFNFYIDQTDYNRGDSEAWKNILNFFVFRDFLPEKNQSTDEYWDLFPQII